MGIGCVFIPLYRYSSWWLLLQIPVTIIFLRGAFKIFLSWEDKKRKYNLLIQRNTNAIRHDTFGEFMQAPCGRLLVKLVLKDLNLSTEYLQLQHLRKPLYKTIKENCQPQRHTIYINPNFNPNKKQ